MTRLIVYLSDAEYNALQSNADENLRGIREQARFLILKALAAETVQHIPARQALPAKETSHAQAA